ncbi:hypothetical protein FRB96_000389 [Tulasnella sp. 330]|nr:hypothetical protein FRB96_000389 [Tulasnella sp. 330]KAG8885334.1 hypothetical protein FRB97_001409 [Tulasnella sp. 331]
MSSELDLGWSYPNEHKDTLPSSTPNPQSTTQHTPGRVYTSIPAQGMPHPIKFLDFGGQPVADVLEPPEIDVVKRALTMLIDSTQCINKERPSMITQDADPDECVKVRLSEVIKVACQALVREADTLSRDLRREYDASALKYRRQRDAHLADLAYRWNTFAPITNLPIEVFSNILILAAAVENVNKHPEVLMALAIVGKHWKEVVISTPQLWSRLQEHMSSAQLKLAIERSGTTPLEIVFQGEAQYSGAYAKQRFATAVNPVVQRWGTLDCWCPPQGLLDLLEFEASSLQNIRLISRVPGDDNRFGLGIGARLRSLELSRVVTDWSSARIQGLVSLSLSYIPEKDAPSTTQLTHIIRSSPDLEVLALNEVGVGYPQQSDILDMEPFPPFKHLRMLKLKTIPYDCYNYLLSRLHFSNCLSIELQRDVSITARDLSTYATLDAYRHDTPAFAAQVKRALLVDGAVVVTFGRGSRAAAQLASHGWAVDKKLEWVCPGFSLSLRSAFDLSKFDLKAVRGMVELVKMTCALDTPIHLSIRLGMERSDFPLECLTALENSVVALSLEGDADLRSVMWHLGQRQDISDGGEGRHWLLPRLRGIDISAWYGTQSVVVLRQMVQDRWVKCKNDDSGMGSEGSVEVIMPTRKGGKTEYWKPVTRKRRSGRKKAPVSEDDSDEERSTKR